MGGAVRTTGCAIYVQRGRQAPIMMRFDRFTEKAQEAAMRAYEILQQYKHTQVDTEHVFLALMQQDGGAVPQIMKQLDAPVAEMVQKTCRAPASTPMAAATLPRSLSRRASSGSWTSPMKRR
jgi:ATP-dependent Clp protease ATP-binding subunit ClpA